MAKQNYEFEGKAAWLLGKPDKWGKYTVCFYPKDAETRKQIKALGLRNNINEDDGAKSGVEGLFYRFKTDGAPFLVTDIEGNRIEKRVGNGSDIVMRLEVESFTSPTHGECVRSRVLSLVVTNLIEYVPEKKETPAEVAEIPAE